MDTETTRLEALDAEACLRLLTEHPVKLGRLAFVVAGYPVVLPVNYRMDGRTVIFRTGIGTKLDSAAAGLPLAFEVDQVDEQWQEGWSVLVQGRGEEVVAPAEVARLRGLGLQPWGPGERSHYIRIRPERLTGRRII